MTSDTIFASDQKQSIGQDFVDQIIKRNDTAVAEGRLHDVVDVPTPGRSCPKDKKHGRMLMSAKSGMLECGPCGFQVAP